MCTWAQIPQWKGPFSRTRKCLWHPQSPRRSVVHTSLTSLQHVGCAVCGTIHSDGARCKPVVKDEGDINKLKDFSVTTYCKCGWVGCRSWQSQEHWEITSFHCFISLTLMLFLQMNALGRPRISFHRADAIKRLKNGGSIKQEPKGGASSVTF